MCKISRRTVAYHVHCVEADGKGNPSGESIVDTRTDDQILGIPQAMLQNCGWRQELGWESCGHDIWRVDYSVLVVGRCILLVVLSGR